ncbi:MAG: GFA family protein [Sphingomonadaceae bacterium]
MTLETTSITGGCLCQAVRLIAHSAPIATRICWCRVCQKLGAGSGTVNAAFRCDAIVVTGELTDFVSVADSGNRMHRRFCPRCGTHVLSASDNKPELIFVRVGVLDDPEVVRPSAVIWRHRAPSWACVDSDLPSYGDRPPSLFEE